MSFNVIKIAKEFGIKYALKQTYNKLMIKITKNQNFRERYFTTCLKYLEQSYGNILTDCKSELIEKNCNVWMFWWQGINESTPEIVKKCLESVKRNFPNNNIVIVTKDNFKNFIDIPQYILKKVESKIITLTHFSDIIRACLLSKHGGIWMDATIYMHSPLKDDLTKFAFYTNRFENNSNFNAFVAKTNWSAFFLAAGKNNPIMQNLKNVFFEYWKTHNVMIDYFLIDFIIKMSYDTQASIKQLIDDVPNNNPNIHDLFPCLFEEFNEIEFKKLTEQTQIFKLSYKFDENNYKLENTFYKHLSGK